MGPATPHYTQKMGKILELKITANNINSFNMSTYGGTNNKTFVKIEGITSKKSDIILISDCRIGKRGKEVERIFGLALNGKYKLYQNSDKDSRGVAIAIKGSVYHEILQKWVDIDNNYLIMRVRIQDREILLGTVYGPNNNDVQFYDRIKGICDSENIPVILGGDFNTVLDNRDGDMSVDRLGNGNCPNIGNSRYLNNWIAEGEMFDPFRVLYPEITSTRTHPLGEMTISGKID